jgi:hypothetical protein
MKDYITGPSTRPFVMYGAGGSGKSSMLSMTAYRAAYEWLQPAQPLLFVRFCGTTPNSTSLGPLLKSICQQICYTFLLPFQAPPSSPLKRIVSQDSVSIAYTECILFHSWLVQNRS